MVYNNVLYTVFLQTNAKLTLVPVIGTCDAASTGAKYFQSQHPTLVYANNVYLITVYIRIQVHCILSHAPQQCRFHPPPPTHPG